MGKKNTLFDAKPSIPALDDALTEKAALAGSKVSADRRTALQKDAL